MLAGAIAADGYEWSHVDLPDAFLSCDSHIIIAVES